MFNYNGVPTKEMLSSVFPTEERINKGPVAVIECFREIPCNPCATACKIGAIRPFEDINDLPNINNEECTGCGMCVSACPGLAIMIVDGSKSKENIIFRIPFEFRPLPSMGDIVDGLDRSGKKICDVKVIKVQNLSYQDKTPIIHVEVSREYLYDFRNIRVVK
ncbi:MAG: 4Fe-4S dicluster domain-containing protein [Clostridiales bacterium]|nr:4Fe-4S dicluster domain-containing protein [Clostridiales bacterium]